MIYEEFIAACFSIKQADNDAVLIFKTTIQKTTVASNRTVVNGEDVNLLILVTAGTHTEKIIS